MQEGAMIASATSSTNHHHHHYDHDYHGHLAITMK
jgi:hypothetical protein